MIFIGYLLVGLVVLPHFNFPSASQNKHKRYQDVFLRLYRVVQIQCYNSLSLNSLNHAAVNNI